MRARIGMNSIARNNVTLEKEEEESILKVYLQNEQNADNRKTKTKGRTKKREEIMTQIETKPHVIM